jgi:uncharacterized protein (TIGR02001 family)
MNARFQRFAGGVATVCTALMLVGPAFADGLPTRGSMKDTPKPQERCKHSANVALTTEYVFRGISQTSEGPAIQGGFDVTCGIFYAGVWASNLDWGGTGIYGFSGNDAVANIEMDWYIGIKPVTGKITWDLGVIYYSYPNAADLGVNALALVDTLEYNYVELKVGASAEIWKDGTVGGTVFFSPDYQYESGQVWTLEGTFTQNLPKFTLWREWSPSFSALIGYQTAAGDSADKLVYRTNVTGDDDHYVYWNVGLTLGFLEKWSIDFRYWDTSIDRPADNCKGPLFACDERFVGTLKFTF